jgi:hypothetical protein
VLHDPITTTVVKPPCIVKGWHFLEIGRLVAAAGSSAMARRDRDASIECVMR